MFFNVFALKRYNYLIIENGNFMLCRNVSQCHSTVCNVTKCRSSPLLYDGTLTVLLIEGLNTFSRIKWIINDYRQLTHSNRNTRVKNQNALSQSIIPTAVRHRKLYYLQKLNKTLFLKMSQINPLQDLPFNFIFINPLTPNDPYSGRTAPLTSNVAF